MTQLLANTKPAARTKAAKAFKTDTGLGMPVADNKLRRFLSRVPYAHWSQPPSVWGEQLRQALNDGLVTVGWGGILELTDDGRAKSKEQPST